MSKRVIVARNTERTKVTTIDIRRGEQGVPFGWEYIICEKDDIPSGNLNKLWGVISKGKVIRTSLNAARDLREVNEKHLAIETHLKNLDNKRKEMLQELDIEFLRTFEKRNKKSKQKRDAIIRFKEALRNMNYTVEDFKTVEEALDFYPPILKNEIKNYLVKKHTTTYIVIAIVLIMIITLSTLFIL